MLDIFDFDATGGAFSGPVLGAFLAAFGFGAALWRNSDNSIGASTIAGLLAAFLTGGIAWFITTRLIGMHSTAAINTASLVGRQATVVTPIPDSSRLGEISIHSSGQQLKLNARSESGRIETGTRVVVSEVLSATSVVVRNAKEEVDE